jgi:D-alanyl-D-alanine carboxypeptidase (penicillin-binding protein 5/6)
MDRCAMIVSLSRRTVGIWALASVLASTGAMAAPAPKAGEGGFNTAAPNAILIEAESGSVLFEKNADALVPPASLAKLMTAEVVLNEIRQGRLKPTDEFIVSVNAWRNGGAPSRTTSMFIPVHSRVTIDDLLRGVIIQSANDASMALAEGISGNEDKFADLMTQRAREIGLTKSTFGNSTGLPHPQQLMTVRELAKLAQYTISTYPEYYPYYAEREYTFNKIRQTNRNPLLTMSVGADGLKTGFIKESGYGLVGSAVQNELRLIVAATGFKNEKERAEESRKLLEWGFHNFQQTTLFEPGQIIAEAKTYGGEQRYVPLLAPREVRLMTPRGVRERLTARVVYSGPVRAPVQKGQKVGILKVWRGDVLALEVPLEAAESVGTGSIPGRAWDAAGELLYGLFRAGIQRL